MSPKKTFSKAQVELLLNVLRKHRPRFRNQEQLALAVGLSQPSLSTMLKGKWSPGVTTARAIANLDGQTLEDLLGDWQQDEPGPTPSPKTARSAAPLAALVSRRLAPSRMSRRP